MTEKQFKQKQSEMTNEQLSQLVEQQLSKLCKTGGKSLIMSVPPQVDDFDMLICELNRRFKEMTTTKENNDWEIEDLK